MEPCPKCDEAAVIDEYGCCVHCGADRRMHGREIALTDVIAAFGRDDALTVTEVAERVVPQRWRWEMRGTIRNRLYELEAMGVLISDEGRPMEFALNELVKVLISDGRLRGT